MSYARNTTGSLRRRGTRYAGVALLSASLFLSGTSTSAAASGTPAGAGGANTGGTYESRIADLFKKGDPDKLCVQQADADVRCFDSAAAFLTAEKAAAADVGVKPMALSQCTPGRFCIWEWTDYNGAMQYADAPGTWQLDSLFNLGTSGFNNRSTLSYGVDSGCPDYVLGFPPRTGYRDFSAIDRPCGGTWNNRIDILVTR